MEKETTNKIRLASWLQVREAFRSKELRQAGYAEGAVVMADTSWIYMARLIENAVGWKIDCSDGKYLAIGNMNLGRTIDITLSPFIENGRGDLSIIGYRCAMNLTATIAGIDQDPAEAKQTEILYGIVKKFSEGATLLHSTRDKDEVREEVREAMGQFARDFYLPSRNARQLIIDEIESGARDEEDMPKDVLSTLLRNRDQLSLSDEIIFREICFIPSRCPFNCKCIYAYRR